MGKILDTDVNKYLTNLYYDPANAASFSGPDKLYRAVKKIGAKNISKGQIKKWLQSQEAYTLNKQVNRNFERPRVITGYLNYLMGADLVDYRNLEKYNDGYKYFLLTINALSKFVHTVPLKTKQPSEIIKAFKLIFETTKPTLKIFSDKGGEFSSEKVQEFFKENNIEHYVSQNEIHSSFTERAIKTIKSKLHRYMYQFQSKTWYKVLAKITKSYNDSYHRTIKMAPSDVTPSDDNRLWKLMYPLVGSNNKNKQRKKKFRYKIGDSVRIADTKQLFDRAYTSKWSGEIFFITNRFLSQNTIPLYTLKDFSGDAVIGTFFEEEMQRVYLNDNQEYKIEKIEGYKYQNGIKYAIVKWLNWNKKYNTLVKVSDLKELK